MTKKTVYYKSNDKTLVIIESYVHNNDAPYFWLYWYNKIVADGDKLAYCKRQARGYTNISRLQWERTAEHPGFAY